MSSTNIKYFKPEIQSKALTNLGLPRDILSKKVVVITNETKTDNGRRLLSLHYNHVQIKNILSGSSNYSQSEINSIKSCRGIIVDADTGEKILQSYPHTDLIITNNVPVKNLLPISSSEGYVVPTNGKYTRCYGGTLARIFFCDGKARLSTHKTIDATNSHFAGSDMFVNIFLKHQTVFPTLDSLYDVSDHDAIHLFILNDRDLIVDSREKQDVDRIVYLESYSIRNPEKNCDLTSYIESKVTDKTIEICKPLTPEKVNEILSGKIRIQSGNGGNENDRNNGDNEDDEDYESLQKEQLLSNFSGGDRVIYKNEYGIFTLMPTSCFFRSRILDGKINIKNLFVRSIGDLNTSELVKIAFSLSDLHDIVDKIKNNKPLDLTQYIPIENQPILTVLTNLIFIVPEHRIDECFKIYESYGASMLETVQFIASIRGPLFESILENRLDKYDGIQSTGVKFQSYLKTNIPHCMNHEVDLNKFIGPNASWPEEVHDFYAENYKVYTSDTSSQSEKENALEVLKIISIVMSSLGENLYSFYTYKTKVEKERIAIEKRTLKSTLKDI